MITKKPSLKNTGAVFFCTEFPYNPFMKKVFCFLFGFAAVNCFAQPYCTTNLYTTGCTSGDDIGFFSINTISNATTGCPGGASGYADYTTMSTMLQAGNTYTIQVATSSPSWSQGFGVWVDFNSNYDFNDPGEFLYASPNAATSTTTFVATVTIPVTAPSSTTILRVRGTYAGVLTSAQSCAQLNFGETEDYTVIINNITATTSSTVDGCPANGSGSASVSTTGGTPPYTFIWNPGGQTTMTATGLTSGIYSVTVSDAIGISTVKPAIVYNNVPVTLSSSTNLTCFGSNDGATTATIGGTSPHTYLWSTGATTQTISALPAGVYMVTATNADGCSNSAIDTITTPALLTNSMSTTPVSCTGNNGTAKTTVSGGTSAYTYFWGNGQSTSAISGLSPGTFTVLITDAHGCTTAGSVNVVTATFSSSTAASPTKCMGGKDGLATSVVSTGGTKPYTYSWSNGQTSQVATGLVAGVYTVTTTDAVGCTTVKTATVTSPTNGVVASTTAQPASCSSCTNGSATANATGGFTPYSYLWSTGSATKSISSLGPGNYTVCVTDGLGCTSCDTVNVMINGIGEIYTGASVIISPNPFSASARVQIEFVNPTHNGLLFSLFDLFGRKVHSVELKENKGASVNFTLRREDNIPNGLYFYRLEDEKGILSAGKIVIQ